MRFAQLNEGDKFIFKGDKTEWKLIKRHRTPEGCQLLFDPVANNAILIPAHKSARLDDMGVIPLVA